MPERRKTMASYKASRSLELRCGGGSVMVPKSWVPQLTQGTHSGGLLYERGLTTARVRRMVVDFTRAALIAGQALEGSAPSWRGFDGEHQKPACGGGAKRGVAPAIRTRRQLYNPKALKHPEVVIHLTQRYVTAFLELVKRSFVHPCKCLIGTEVRAVRQKTEKANPQRVIDCLAQAPGNCCDLRGVHDLSLNAGQRPALKERSI